MGLFDKLFRKFSYVYCKECKKDMREIRSKLYFVPLNASTEIPLDIKFDFFEQNAVPVEELLEIPTGFHGGYAKVYRCESCSKQSQAFEVFLPVRGQIVPKRNIEVHDNRLKNLKDYI